MYNIISDLIKAGTFKKMIQKGIISTKVQGQFDMVTLYNSKRVKSKQIQYDWEAIEIVAIKYQVSPKTVYLAIKSME